MEVAPVFFATPAELRAWLERNHEAASELWVGFRKKGSGKPSITWPEAVDQALCFGWIDGLRKSVDETGYMIRFTPRKSRSTWSLVNVKRVQELAELGLMRPAGLAAFEARREEHSGVYSYEQRNAAKLARADERQFRANEKAWAFFQAQPPWYRRAAVWWVVSAKKDETRIKRLATLVEHCEQGRTVPPLTRPTKSA
jgi:uncharacterized protein YdeI (YjbR/CyaY-like superfamily)